MNKNLLNTLMIMGIQPEITHIYRKDSLKTQKL